MKDLTMIGFYTVASSSGFTLFFIEWFLGLFILTKICEGTRSDYIQSTRTRCQHDFLFSQCSNNLGPSGDKLIYTACELVEKYVMVNSVASVLIL